MGLREWFSLQYFRVQQVQAIASSLIAILSLGILLAIFLGWSLWWQIPVVVLTILTFIFITAWVWDMIVKTWIARQEVAVKRNPYSNWRLTPREQIQFGETTVPVMRAAREILLKMESNPHPDELGLTEKNIEKWERIAREGRIQREDYPAHLQESVWEEAVGLPRKGKGPRNPPGSG